MTFLVHWPELGLGMVLMYFSGIVIGIENGGCLFFFIFFLSGDELKQISEKYDSQI